MTQERRDRRWSRDWARHALARFGRRAAPGAGAIVAVLLCWGLATPSPANDLVQAVLQWDEDRVRGNPDAPVVLIEYSDFTCGFCRKFFTDTWPKLKAKYVDTGQLFFVYKDYPRSDRGPGIDGAVAARCAGAQGQYWAMHDRLFGASGRFDRATFERHAKAIGLDLPAFTTCLRERAGLDNIFYEKAQALQLGFRGTPGFILFRRDAASSDSEDLPLVGIPGALPYDVFEEHIERLLTNGKT